MTNGEEPEGELALRNRIGTREKVTEALFTFVAIDENGRPRFLPPERAA